MEIEGSPWIYAGICCILGNRGVCRDTTWGRRACVVLHAVTLRAAAKRRGTVRDAGRRFKFVPGHSLPKLSAAVTEWSSHERVKFALRTRALQT